MGSINRMKDKTIQMQIYAVLQFNMGGTELHCIVKSCVDVSFLIDSPTQQIYCATQTET